MGSVACEHCTGVCCRYIALPLDKPKTRRDFDDMRWYLLHDGVLIFVEDGDWYIQVSTTCRHLQPGNRCGIYETRPAICREYKAGECDYTDAEYDYEHLFTTPDQLQDYAKTWQAKRAARKRAKGSTVKPRTARSTASRRANGAIRAPKRALGANGQAVALTILGRSL